jgi:diguanylate cyclase (GGDEF)-like protein
MSDNKKSKILIVSDNRANLDAISKIPLSEYELENIPNGNQIIEVAIKVQPDLVLLDVENSETTCFDLLVKLKELAETKKIPIIFITGPTDEAIEEKALMLGAADYISRPFRNIVVRARIHTQLQIVKQRQEIEMLSMIDPLTGISNKRNFDIRLEMEWARAIRERAPISLLLLDIDKSKDYNDQYGYPQGDALLKTAAGVIKKSARRATDFSSHIGGDEFAVLLPSTGLEGALIIADCIRTDLEETVIHTIDGSPTSCTISVGVSSSIPRPGDKSSDFVSATSGFLNHAKKTGRNKICFYEE